MNPHCWCLGIGGVIVLFTSGFKNAVHCTFQWVQHFYHFDHLVCLAGNPINDEFCWGDCLSSVDVVIRAYETACCCLFSWNWDIVLQSIGCVFLFDIPFPRGPKRNRRIGVFSFSPFSLFHFSFSFSCISSSFGKCKKEDQTWGKAKKRKNLAKHLLFHVDSQTLVKGLNCFGSESCFPREKKWREICFRKCSRKTKS